MKFEIVSEEHRKHPDEDIVLPVRKTKYSAGYDFTIYEDIWLNPGDTHIFWTDVKICMPVENFLMLTIRSSYAKEGLTLSNSPGIIDADYYGNESNDGNIGFMVRNFNINDGVRIKAGESIGQGIIVKYDTTFDDDVQTERTGGMGSTC